MASFMTKKKKYKFQVSLCLEELLEVPFVSAVLFAKIRLLDGGNFQDHSSREEVRDHKVKWGANFSFPCKMSANASTGVLERCILRISVRKECKGGRSFTKLGFVDLNLAEYAGAGVTFKKALLEGYDARHRQDNSMLKFSIAMHMLSGDILFKVPSPSLKHKSIASEDPATESRTDEFSSESLGGSIASGSSGFGSLPKKRPALLSSELVIGHTLVENSVPVTVAVEGPDQVQAPEHEEVVCETGHSRNSSNTSQLSKASGYSSIHSHCHSRQSSSGDSGHIRALSHRQNRKQNGNPFLNSSNFIRVNTFPNRIRIPNTIIHEDVLNSTLETLTPVKSPENGETTRYYTPDGYHTQLSNVSGSSTDDYKTPDESLDMRTDLFSQKFTELRKSSSTSLIELNAQPNESDLLLDNNRLSADNAIKIKQTDGVLKSKSDFEIPRVSPIQKTRFRGGFFRSDNLPAFLTPILKRKSAQSTPKNPDFTSLNSLRTGTAGTDQLGTQPRGLPHRKLLEGASGGKLAPLAISPDETPTTVSSDCSQNLTIRRPSVTTNPSSSSLVLSETGSLDRAKAAYERRKKTQIQDSDTGVVSGRVENTRVNANRLIAEILKDTNLEQADDSAETSGLQLFIAKDGTAALGNHEVKSQMSTGAQVFKQVVMDDNR
ncbi:Protein FAM102A-like Protein [Tribolium castaneum]|uniref:Protein FAM102A-like Protein n=2 Tax=Tribolium castaneum TaxID=7070 RepID=A0A139WN46_TRICA|nr:Protein FAM102A-like Protein [Tribolium castaneum]